MNYKKIAMDVFEIEGRAILDLKSQLDESFNSAIELLMTMSGQAILVGLGKSGHVARKISATLASTGTPSVFLHPTEALHGDLGMVRRSDVIICLSNSGETIELLSLLPFFKTNGNPVISITSSLDSTLGREADCSLLALIEKEACPLQLAPTTSAMVAMAIGDAIAVTLMKVKGFSPENFAKFHPGGFLGTQVLSKVSDVMIGGNLPIVEIDDTFLDVLRKISTGQLGLAIVGDDASAIITDGDIRRAIAASGPSVIDMTAKELATYNPKTIAPNSLMKDAYASMTLNSITSLLVVSDAGDLVGIVKK